MKRKFISNQEYFGKILPQTRISFGTISPFLSLNIPPDKTAFVAWYGNTSFGSGSSLAIGTLEVARWGAGTVTYDFDKYPIYSTGTATVYELVGPLKPSYHWSQDIPKHLGSQMPTKLATFLSDKQ